MKRWNGWGDEHTNYPLPELAEEYLSNIFDKTLPPPDAQLEEVIGAVPPSPLRNYPFINVDPEDRLRHACGQSLPDWINLRSGRIPRFPDGVIYPSTEEEVMQALEFSDSNQIILIPYGGGTSVVGHINPPLVDTPVLTVDLMKLNKLVELDETSLLATFEAGITGLQLEAELSSMNYTLGHFPQSFEFSTLGGWVATRSSGQQSYYYGRIEDLFRGGYFITPNGPMEMLPYPASAAGPDLRHLILGSEGRFGILTRATVAIKPTPKFEEFYGYFFKAWESGLMAVRELAQNDVQLSMIRLSDAQETETAMILTGKRNLVRWAGFGLAALGYRKDRCLLIIGVTGLKSRAMQSLTTASQICHKYGGLYAGSFIGKSWKKSRFIAPYLRNSLWEHGYALDTLETSVTWDKVQSVKSKAIEAIIEASRSREEKVLAFGHLSHVYPTGASIYITYLFRRSPDPDENLHRWEKMKAAASHAILDSGGTISHQHGIGRDHARYVLQEKGEIGINLLIKINEYMNPKDLLNPGVMIEDQNSIKTSSSDTLQGT
jgi:alkyldihydroxyacetonephosphate synthase